MYTEWHEKLEVGDSLVQLLGEMAAMGTAICWSFSSVLFAVASKRVGPLVINLLRLPLAIFLLMATYTILQGKFAIAFHSAMYLALSGVIGLAIGDTFLFNSMVMVGARLSMLLLSLSPPITALLAYIFLGEVLNWLDILGILITLIGVIWVVLERPEKNPVIQKQLMWKGVVLGFLSALAQAVGLLWAKMGLGPNVDPLYGTLIRMSSAALILWPMSFLLKRIKNPVKLIQADTTALKYLLAGVIMGPFLGVWLSLVAVKYTNTGIAATIMSIVPVTMIPLSIKFEKETPSLRSIAGAVIAIIGIAILFLS